MFFVFSVYEMLSFKRFPTQMTTSPTLQTGVKLAGGCTRLQSIEKVTHFADGIFLAIFIQEIKSKMNNKKGIGIQDSHCSSYCKAL